MRFWPSPTHGRKTAIPVCKEVLLAESAAVERLFKRAVNDSPVYGKALTVSSSHSGTMGQGFDPVPGWETLLATQLCGGQVHGKLRLVKILSILQLEGFPIPFRFQEFARGPHTTKVEKRAKACAQAGLLVVEQHDVKDGWEPRVDYKPTPQGTKKASEYLRTLLTSEDGDLYRGILQDVLGRYNFQLDGNSLSRHVHEILIWDSEEDFRKAFHDVLNWFEESTAAFVEPANESDEKLLIAAAAETALATLRAIEPKIYEEQNRDEFVGIRFIRYLSDYIRQDLITCKAGLDGEEGLRRLRQHLHALESNAIRYGFLDPVEDDDIEAMLQEAGSSVQDLET